MLYHQYLVFWVSTYHLMVSLLTLPAVETKKLLVHKDGIFASCGNSSRSAKEVAPLSWCMISEGLSVGRQLKDFISSGKLRGDIEAEFSTTAPKCTKEELVNFVETAMLYSLSFDLLVPPFYGTVSGKEG